jgi:hypothetical protein
MRLTWFFAMGALLLCLQGCETAKGFTGGLQGDVKNMWDTLFETDGWLRENMW